MTILGIFVFVVIVGSFGPIWDEYETMGAFVTLETLWFAGMLWTPNSWWCFRLLFGFLLVLGIETKFRQIDHINKSLGADLRKNRDGNSRADTNS